MSRQFRYRVTAIVLGGALLGGPLPISGTASAGQTAYADRAEAGMRQVTFAGGGMLGHSCRSRPDVESMVVPANSRIRVLNRTGHDARLELGGRSKRMLADDSATEVVFRRGTTAVLVTPTCAHRNDATPVLVTASPSALAVAAATMPNSIPVPTGAVTPDADRPSDATGSSGSDRPDAVTPTERPSRPAANAHRPKASRPRSLSAAAVAPAVTSAAQAMPPAHPKRKTRTAAGTRGSTAPALSGMPSGVRRPILPRAPRLEAPPVTTDAAPVPVPPAPPAPEMAAAVEPLPDRGPVGLLALIASVFALGVGIAAIRAFVSERANRSRIA